MVFAPWSPSSTPASHQVHGASTSVVKHFVIYLLLPYHIMCPLQNKVRRLYFIFCTFYVAARDFTKELFLTYELLATTTIKQLSLLHPSRGPPLKMSYHHCMRDRHPPAAYMVQAICQVWNQSHVSVLVRSVRACSSYNPAVWTSARGRVIIIESMPTYFFVF